MGDVTTKLFEVRLNLDEVVNTQYNVLDILDSVYSHFNNRHIYNSDEEALNDLKIAINQLNHANELLKK